MGVTSRCVWIGKKGRGSRGPPTPYPSVPSCIVCVTEQPPGSCLPRPLQIKHVQQIKALFPEALGWEHVLALNPSTKRQEQQLVISMPRDPSNPKQAVDTAQMQQTFFQRLQHHQVGPAAPSTCLPACLRLGCCQPLPTQRLTPCVLSPPVAGMCRCQVI